MREPLFTEDLDTFGEMIWIEVEGYERMIRRAVGAMIGAEKEILGWDVETLGDTFQKQKEVNFAPRVRYWKGEEMPTKEERANGTWKDIDRLWLPSVPGGTTQEQWDEFKATGRTAWPLPPDPDDPVKLNAELAEKGDEPLAPMCAGCHFGKWKNGYERRWIKTKYGNEKFWPCDNIGVDGWKHWMEYQEQPETCEGYCKIGEYKPQGIFAEMAGVMKGIENIPAGGRKDGRQNEN